MGDNFDNNDVERNLAVEVDVDGKGANADTEIDDNDNAEVGSSDEGKEVTIPKQTSKQDRAFADMRKKLEAAEKEAKQYRELNNKAAYLFKDYGVKSIDEYISKLEVQELENKKEKLKDAGYTDEQVEEMVKTEVENLKLKQEVESYKKQQEDVKLMTAYDAVAAEYPELVKAPEDIPPEAWLKFEKGYSLLDAFESVNRKQIREMERQKAAQKTLNNLNSKKHLKAEGDGPGNASDTMIDQDALQHYLDMGFSKKDAIAHYKKLYG